MAESRLAQPGEPAQPSSIGDGIRLAVTTLTVLPWPAGNSRPTGRIDRRAGAVAMSLAPAIGLGIGGLAAGAADVLLRYGLSPLTCAVLVVIAAALLTRGLHLDGLADTVDGLASYRRPQAALAIMKSPEVGPLGVAAIVAALLAETAALASLISGHSWLAIMIAYGCGRCTITWYCRRGVPAARPDGLGALVAGTVPSAVACGWTTVALAASWAATERHWTGTVAVAATLAVSLGLLWHVRRRLGGITGDVLGAGCEIGTALALVLFSVR